MKLETNPTIIAEQARKIFKKGKTAVLQAWDPVSRSAVRRFIRSELDLRAWVKWMLDIATRMRVHGISIFEHSFA